MGLIELAQELWNSQALGQCKMAPPAKQELIPEYSLDGALGPDQPWARSPDVSAILKILSQVESRVKLEVGFKKIDRVRELGSLRHT